MIFDGKICHFLQTFRDQYAQKIHEQENSGKVSKWLSIKFLPISGVMTFLQRLT